MMKKFLLFPLFVCCFTTLYAQSKYDLNHDNHVNVGDVTTLVNSILGKGEAGVDLNGDGNINVGDVTKLVNVILGKTPDDTPPSDEAVQAGLCPDNNHPHQIDMGEAGTWACCNLGATTPFETGGYFAWSEIYEKEVYSLMEYKYYMGDLNGDGYLQEDELYDMGTNISGNLQRDAAAAQWGDSWVMPCHNQYEELLNKCTHQFVTINGVNGEKFTAPNGNNIFLPVTDFRNEQGYGYTASETPNEVNGYYWTATFAQNRYAYINQVSRYSDYAGLKYHEVEYGCAIRPIVELFPRKDYDVEVCAHRYGKRMTYTDQSDQLKLCNGITDFDTQVEKGKSYDWITEIAKARGLKIGFFAYYAEPKQADFAKALADWQAGHIWIDQYSWTPELGRKISTGANITPEEFREAYETYLLPKFLAATGHNPLALSYSYGNHTFEDATCPLYLAGRQSGDANCGGTDYGLGYGNPDDVPYSMEAYKSKPSSYRWWDRAQEMIRGGMSENTAYETAINNVASAIDATKLNGGWFRNFTHFHSMMQGGATSRHYAEAYYDMLADKNVDDEIHFAGYGEAVAYLVYRQMIVRAEMYIPTHSNGSQLVIQLETRNTLGVDESLLQVPISIKFSTQGTPLSGHDIISDQHLISLGREEYIVEIPFSRFPKATIDVK